MLASTPLIFWNFQNPQKKKLSDLSWFATEAEGESTNYSTNALASLQQIIISLSQ